MQAAKVIQTSSRVEFITMVLNTIQATSKGLHMSEREVEVLAEFLSFTGDVAKSHRFSGTFRKTVMERLMMSSSQMTNILKDLVDKGVLANTSHGVFEMTNALPPFTDDLNSIKITINGPDTRTA